MKWIQIIIISFLLSIPTLGYGTITIHDSKSSIQQQQTISKKEKPKKKLRKWLKKNRGALIFGSICAASITMIILGIINKIRWLWMLGIFGILAPILLSILLGILILLLRRPRPLPAPIPEEKPEPKKDSK